MTADQCKCFLADLEPALAQAGFRRLAGDQLTREQLQFVEQLFAEEISAVLSPMAVSADEEFPLLGNQTLNVCVQLKPQAKEETPRFALIPFGLYSRRFITLPLEARNDQYEYILLEDVVALFAGRFFPGEPVVECVPFRITRNADLSVREDLAADLMVSMEEILDARKQSACVRLEISANCTTATLGVFAKHARRAGEQRVCLAGAPRSVGIHAADRCEGLRPTEVRILAAAAFAGRRSANQPV